ncbi:MAG: DUF1553 domain-containing protein [Bryobacteraceae bacterium]|jgi:hypothetical protein
MNTPRWVPVLAIGGLLIFCGALIIKAQDGPGVSPTGQMTLVDANCSFFGPDRDKFAYTGLNGGTSVSRHGRALSELTSHVGSMVASPPPGSSTSTFGLTHQAGSIDSYLQADWKANGITPAPMTTDWEFIRRVTLDLTGRIPDPARVLSFVADTTPTKRAALIEELLAKPEWVDKWTMYFGDLFQNTVTKNTSGVNRLASGRNAFYLWIHNSLVNSVPYNQMASQLISIASTNTFQDGPANFLVGGFIGTGPSQDAMDQMTANVFDTFMGIAHVNCLLCHNGRGHLDTLSLWASGTVRYQAWQLSSFLSHTQAAQTKDSNNNPSYWTLQDNPKGYTVDYTLNTTTGNRPARVAPAGCKSGQPCYYVPPQYIFNGSTPTAGTGYRAALASDITNDFQFARAAVNFIWAQFFGMGIVDPPDTFDPARLDPSNPPPAPWTLQPSDANLLNALATHFIQNGYSMKALMREIVNSQTYQLSSRYNGQWNVAWEPLFARKNVRRLWSEEVHDAVAQSSGTFPSYTMTGYTDQGGYYPTKISYAMQLPDVINAPTSDGNASNLLDSFLRGNRDDQPRKEDGSILQALNLMNNPFVEARIQYAGSAPSQLIATNLTLSNTALINTLYLAILSRYPTGDEMTKSTSALTSASNRSQAVQDLVWSLYNKVDFVFNY